MVSSLIWCNFVGDMDKIEAVILVGSNHRLRELMVETAVLRLSEMLDGFRRSKVIESSDVTGKSAPYLNAVCSGFTCRSLADFTELTKSIEKDLGRTAESKSTGVVEIDIDIVMWGKDVLKPRDATSDYFTTPFATLAEK